VKRILEYLCSSQDNWWLWLGGQTHRRGACTRVGNWKVMVDYPHTCVWWFGVKPDGCIECCGESVPPLQRIETIRIAASVVMDDWMAILYRCQMFSKWLLTWQMICDWKGMVIWDVTWWMTHDLKWNMNGWMTLIWPRKVRWIKTWVPS